MRRFKMLFSLLWIVLLLVACSVLDPLISSSFPTTTFFPHTTVPATTSAIPSRWESVYVTDTGEKFHAQRDCCRMRNPTRLTRQEAVRRGYTPCSRCYKDEENG